MAKVSANGIMDAAVNPAAFALPSAGSGTTRSAQIDLGTSSGTPAGTNQRLEDIELEIVAPAVTNGMVGNGETMTYSVEHSTASGSGYAILLGSVIVQTGAGAGVATSTKSVVLPHITDRYISVRAVSSAGCGNASSVSCTVNVRFRTGGGK